MAFNQLNGFRNIDKVTKIRYLVTDSLGDIFSADATYLRDITRLICINTSSSAVTLTLQISDGTNHDTFKVLTIPANAGFAAGVEAVKLLLGAEGTNISERKDPSGNTYFRLTPTIKLRAVASTTGVLVINGDIESFEPS